MIESKAGIGGWQAPSEAFNYRELAAAAEGQRKAIQGMLERLKRERPKTAERELLRRREIRLLTDMYYEQRGNALLFAGRARQQEEGRP